MAFESIGNAAMRSNSPTTWLGNKISQAVRCCGENEPEELKRFSEIHTRYLEAVMKGNTANKGDILFVLELLTTEELERIHCSI